MKVKKGHQTLSIPIKEAISQIKGQVVLVGESGLGKSMFIRYLLKESKRLTVYLPAEKCSKGIMEAFQAKLLGVARDEKFLRNLIYSGTIDICIDGLNEVSADTRANLSQFIEMYFKDNFLIATQPIDWIPPKTAETHVLQPLRNEQIEEYLISRYRVLPEDVTVSAADYERAGKEYLAYALDENQPKEMLTSVQRILSNPMDLETVALMLAYVKEPNLFRLQEQQYQIMAEEYEQVHIGRHFPLAEFSERVYQMRINDESRLPKDEFLEEITCMEKHKLLLSRQSADVEGKPTKEWFFRHDKIMEFFIVQTFLGDSNRPPQHMGDPRFRGTYFLLADLMPLDAAIALQQQLVEHAADTKDHSVSDNFIQLVRSRKARKAA